MLTDREEKEHRELRRRERERQKLIKGDDYQSDAESEEAKVEEEEDDYDDETEEDDSEAEESELQDVPSPGLQHLDAKSTRTKKRGASSRMSDGMDIQHRFNALRFLAMNLKS